jgi:uncharacterized repeat protein (TIGR01451 family)
MLTVSKSILVGLLFLVALFISLGYSATAVEYEAAILYSQPPSASGGLLQSSWWYPDESVYDQYRWDNFTLQYTRVITEIQWVGGYDPTTFGGSGSVLDFKVAIYASIPGGLQPDVVNPPLVEYQTGGNAGEMPAGTFGGVPMYDYHFSLPTAFQAQGGTKYWVYIVASQAGPPDWGLTKGTGGDGVHFRNLHEGNIFQLLPGDFAFTLLGPPAPLPLLAITKTVETAHTPVLLGDAITYTVVMANSGSGDAAGVRVTDTLPVGVTGVDLDWTGTITNGDQVAFTIPALVTTSVAFYGQTVANTAHYTHTTGSGSDSASFTIERGAGPNLSGSTKAASPSNQRLTPGDLVTYTITLNNGGGMDASVAVTDVLRSYYTVREATGWVESPAGTLTWSGTVQAGQQVVLQFVARVVDVAGLPIGKTTLGNTLSVDDGVNPVFSVQDASPPWVEIYVLYLPLVLNNL